MQIFLLETGSNLDLINSVKINSAANIIKKGGTVIFPTETVYGLGADIFNSEAIKQIYKIKTRSYTKPLAAHISSLEQVSTLCDEVPDMFYKLAEKFLPGPLSIIIPASNKIPSIVTSYTGTISIRYPDDQVCREFISACGVPLAATSANISGNISPITATQALAELNNKVDAVIDAGECRLKTESTVIKIINDSFQILREGVISKSEILNILK